jgi:hypothetical protein
MNFTAVTPFRPVQRLHPLAKDASLDSSLAGKAFVPPPLDVALAKSMQDAIGRYPELEISSGLAEEWINEAKSFKGVEYMSASMLVAVFVLMFISLTQEPTKEQVKTFFDEVMTPYDDMRLSVEDREDLHTRQLADLWRYTKKVIALRTPTA